MADVDLAFTFVMKNEDSTLSGTVTPEPKGAKARFGVNSNAHPEAITDGFYEMDKDKALEYAKVIFIAGYWKPIHGEELTSQLVANKFADLAFNMNPSPATKVVQRAVNKDTGYQVIEVDGIMGPRSVMAINRLNPETLLAQIRDYAKQRYRDIAFSNPDMSKYLSGWLNRVDA